MKHFSGDALQKKKKNVCAHKLFTYPICAFIIKHSSEHIAKFEAKVVKRIILYKSVSLKRLLQLEPVCKE